MRLTWLMTRRLAVMPVEQGARESVPPRAAVRMLAAASGGVAVGFACGVAAAWPLALLGMVALQLCMGRTQTRAQALLVGMVGMFSWQLSAVWWVMLAVRSDGAHATVWMLAAALLTSAVYSVCALGLWGVSEWVVPRRVRARGVSHLVMSWSLSLLAADVLRREGWVGHGYGGFGVAISGMPGAEGWIPVIGEMGWGACGVLLCGWGAVVAMRRPAKAFSLVVLAAVVGGVILVGNRLAAHAWTDAVEVPRRVLAVQPHLDKRETWTEASRDAAVAQLREAISRAQAGEWVVTPESFFLQPPPAEPDGQWAELLELAGQRRVHLFIGMPHVAAVDERLRLLNAVVHVAPNRTSLYAKERLVPGGEFLPWGALLGPLYSVVFQTVDEGELPGPPELTQPFFAGDVFIGVSVCHEQSFPLLMVARSLGSAVLLNLSDDSWIPSAAYRSQMARIARLRALEAGRPLLRVTNGGATMLMDARGQVAAVAPDGGQHILEFLVHPVTGRTPYQQAASAVAAAPIAVWLGWILLLWLGRSTPLPEEGAS